MNKKSQLCINGLLPSFSENQKKEYEQLQKSVNSLNTDFENFSIDNCINNQDITFTENEIQAAIKRLEKIDYKDQNFDLSDFEDCYIKKSLIQVPFENKEELFFATLFLTVFELIIPDYLYYCELNDYCEIGIDTSLVVITESLLAELYSRKARRILTNILSNYLEKRKLITVQSPIKRTTYEYFDLTFSLKKEVVLKLDLIIKDFIQLLLIGKNEKKYIRNIQTLNRA